MAKNSAKTFNYLRQHYFDDQKLKTLAVAEFVRAMRSGRLVAFTGSMTTKQFGYPEWGDLLDNALDIAAGELDAADVDQHNLISALKEIGKRDSRFDTRVAFSAVAQMLDHKDPEGGRVQSALKAIAKLFTHGDAAADRADTIITALFEELHIDRIVTTNYDLELEAHAMRLKPRPDTPSGKWNILKSVSKEWLDRDGSAKDGYSLVLNLPNGDRIVSDTMQRDRPESLVEFSIGCPENDRHIFHLHGRADQSDRLILSYRDYDRLYRRRGPGKLPFEHALRILFAGNPVLFVGLGMTEPELNKTLSEFVGDFPYMRKAPAFLIWNTPEDWKALKPGENDESFHATRHFPRIEAARRKAAFRLDKLHRLGILTIFADDLTDVTPPPAPGLGNGEKLRRALLQLTEETARAQRRRVEEIPPARWRNALPRIERTYRLNAEARLDPSKSRESVINTWNVEWTPGSLPAPVFPECGKVGADFMTVFIRPEGTSKTAMAMAIARSWSELADDRLAMILNFNMRIDTDSSLALIGDLLHFEEGRSRTENMTRTSSRDSEFADKDCIGLRSGDELLIVLKGLERIFDVNGHPLSAEFDQFLRTMARRAHALPRIRFVVIGTERIKRYFEGLKLVAGSSKIEVDELSPAAASSQTSAYLEFLQSSHDFGALELAKLENRKLSEYSAKRRTLYRSILTPSALLAKGVANPELALEIVTVMSFIGQPIERGALFHAPAVQKRLAAVGKSIAARRKAFNRAFDELVGRVHLIKEINHRVRPAEHHRRYSVHLSLQTEIRDRNGIPLSDSILSTAYNMSLFSAQPADGALPEAQVHDGLGRLVDWLVGAYKDEPLDPGAAKWDRGAPHVVAALRAAVSLVRGLYSTSALLSVDRGDRLISEDREGLLSEHAQRLDRILDAFDATWRARGDGAAKGAEPLYPDELVWLHNERGVVKLAQGDLYEARFSFDEADRVNRLYVEFNDASHNWRRITLNQIVVDIERGHLQRAENRMNSIEYRLGVDKGDRIRIRYLDSRSVRRIRFDPIVSHEDILAIALITGYRGLTSHLKGELDAARIYFERAVRVLQRVDEQRALALFRRHKASLHSDLGDPESARHESRLAVSGAESVRQLDIVYAGRLLEACFLDVKDSSADKKDALRLALEALDYATLADMHRLTIEAEARLAWAKYGSGDYNAALEHAAEAMATATRYGMTLYKISLRVLLGRILISRGNGDAGRTLIRSAINGALRVGYQRAIGSARLALAGTETG